jgi:hypothetical protein
MGEIYRQYKAKGLEILFAAINANPNIEGFVGRYKVPFPVGAAEGDKANVFMQNSVVKPTYVPWLVFIDRAGTIRAQYNGGDALFNGGAAAIAKVVDPLLAGRPAAAPKKAAGKK